MAEEGSVYELEGLQTQLESLLSRYSRDGLQTDSKTFCSDFCKLVEEYTSRWQVPLPQLRILETALSYFARASTFFTLNCDHVLHTLSSLALSVFELLLFFDQKDFHQEPLKRFTVTFQECHSTLARHQNVHLLQVECLVQGGGPWASPVLQQILSESNLPQNEVDGCISSELPVFFELRVRYLLSCERLSEAIALAKCCARHPTAGQHLFFLQVYLTWLYKTSQRDRLHKEVNDLNCKDAVHIICSLEGEENNDLLLGLSRSFLFQQLRRGDMYYLCDLVFIWSKLHNRLKTSKQALLEESHQLMLSATNVNSIFPFIRAILQELGEDGIQFCVELCTNALESCLPCDVITKSLIYKTIAGLLPNDLEVCRACALLVFFVERTVESYKMVYLLYMHPDQEYHVEYSPIGNHIRFEMLQVLKKDLYFDPEFWNLIALRTNCLKLMSEKHVSAALEEIMEDKWIHNYCTKEPALRSITSCQRGNKGAAGKKRHHKDNTDAASKRLKAGSGRTRLNSDNAVKKKGSRSLKEAGSQPLRRSYWQLDRIQDNVASRYGEYRRTTRLSEKNPPKRRIRKPKWLLEDSGNHEENGKMRKHGLRHKKHHRSTVVKRSEPGQIKNSSKQKLSVNSHLKTKENSNKQQGGFSMDSSNKQTPQVVLELSLPDNELMGTFTDDTSNRQRGIPQVLLYKPTVKLPSTSTSTSTSTSQPLKAVHRKEVVLRARDTAMFIQQLHCYYRRQKGKGNAANVQGSVSTITRSSVQGSPPKDSPRESCDKSEVKGSSEASKTTEVAASPFSRKTEKSAAVLQTSPAAETAVKVTKSQVSQPSSKGKLLQSITSTREKCPAETKTSNAASTQNCEEPAVEMKVTIASPTPAAAKISQSQNLDKVSKAQRVDDLSKTTSTAEVSPTTTTTTTENNQKTVTKEISNNSNAGAEERKLKLLSSQAETDKIPEAHAKTETPEALVCKNMAEGNVAEETSVRGNSAAEQGGLNDVSALTLVTEMVTELDKQKAPENVSSKESTAGSKTKVPQKTRTTSSCSPAWEMSAAAAAADKDLELQKDKEDTQDNCSDSPEEPETEESKLEFCCTFCNKVFKGSRVVAHAMFHYRKDECMFCGVMFKDDLLAMMHLSDHIEKLKRIKESTVNKAQENQVSETKDVSTTKTSSAKAKTTDPSPGRRSSGRTKTSAGCPSKSRKLRSDDKPTDRQVFKERKQNASKHLNNKTLVHKLNGHVGKKKKLDTTRKDVKTKQGTSQERRSNGSKDGEMDSSSSSSSVQTQKEFVCSSEDKMKETESLQVLKTATKQNGKTVEEKNVESEEKVRCPVDGCVWFTDLSKNRVALLYHALDDHYGEIKPLELAFRIGHSKCSICMRVLWSFEHFKHHVERHRLAPRHPCLHQGCDARFKTGMEMRRHARRHSPLQAVCCLPGCSRLFICLWALNLHEREHYASKQTKTDKIATEQRGDKNNNATVSKKQDHKPKDATTADAVNKTVSVKAARKLKRQTHNLSSRKHTSSSVRASEPKEKNETKDSNVLKNLSNKDTTAQPTLPNLRLRQTLRKGQATNTKLSVSRSNRVIASLLKHNSKVRYKLKKKQVLVKVKGPARRGRPPKTKKVVHDENTSAESVKDKTSVQNDVKTPTKAAETSTEADERKDQEVLDESKSKKLVKKNHVKQTVNSLKQLVNSTSAETTTKKLTNTDKIKKVHKVKKRPKESSGKTTATDVSKSKKLKVNTKTEKKKCVKEETESEKTELKQTEETAAAEKVESCVDKDKEAENSVPAALEKNEAAAPPTTSAKKTQKVTTEEESVITKKEKHKDTKTKAAPSGSGEAETKHKDVNKKGDKKKVKDKQPCKDLLKTPASKKTKTDSVIQQQDETKTAATSVQSGQKEEEEAAAVTPENSSAPVEENKKVTTEKKSKKCIEKKKSEPNKVRKKRKNQDGDVKIAKKKCKDEGAEDTKPKPEAEPLAEEKVEVKERSAGEEANTTTTEMLQPTPGRPGYSLINGQTASEDAKGSTCRETLSQYSKKPYMRPPPTAYLDEKYITMPKRRKELSLFQSSPRNPPPGQTSAAAAATVATTTQQRQRCANCFATFNSVEDLQSHLQLQKCSNLFGFDSDDEGNS